MAIFKLDDSIVSLNPTDKLVPQTGTGKTDVSLDANSHNAVENAIVATNIANINSYLTADKAGTDVDLSPYTSTLYEVPSDGYVKLYCYSASSAYIRVKSSTATDTSSSGTFFNLTTSANTANARYVKKGMKCCVNNLISGDIATFVPIVS